MDVVAIAPEQAPTTGPMGRWSWISLGGRIRALDPAAWVGWALTLGLTTAVALRRNVELDRASVVAEFSAV